MPVYRQNAPARAVAASRCRAVARAEQVRARRMFQAVPRRVQMPQCAATPAGSSTTAASTAVPPSAAGMMLPRSSGASARMSVSSPASAISIHTAKPAQARAGRRRNADLELTNLGFVFLGG